MFPILDWLKDGMVRTNREVQEKMKEVFNLTEEDLKETTSKGGNKYISNVNWALTFLYQAGLTEKPQNGQHKISGSGKELIAEGITEITEKLLVNRYGKVSPQFFFPNKKVSTKEHTASPHEEQTPEDIIHERITQIEEALAADLLVKVKEIQPQNFEKLVVQLLVKMGYGGSIEDAGSVTSQSHDEGIDGIIKEDILGLDSIYLQAKRYTDNPVGGPELQKFIGALSLKHAKKGVFITTSTFSNQAIEYAKSAEARIILIDGHQLCKYMIQFGLGVTTREVVEIKSIDTDYFTFE